MPELSSLPHYPLKIIFTIHLILVTWGLGSWCPPSVMFYNLLFFCCLLWAVHNVESDEPLQFALFVNVASIMFDVVFLSIYFPSNQGTSPKISAAFMIINMLVRVITSIALLRIGQGRNGPLATIFTPSPTMGFGRHEYEDISHPVSQNSDFVGV